MKTSYYIILLSMLFLCINGFSQKRLQKRADQLFDCYNYSQAIEVYQKILNKKEDNAKAMVKLGDCYRLLGNTKKAEEYYSKAIESGESEPLTYFNYASTLKGNERYKTANEWLLKYSEAVTNDSRIDRHNKEKRYEKKLVSDVGRFEISEVSINSKYSDFSPAYYKNLLIFTSAREINLGIKRRYGWTNEPYLNIFVSKLNGDTLSKPELFDKNNNTKFHNGPVCFTPDENTMYVTRNSRKLSKGKGKKKENHLKIYKYELNDKNKWKNKMELPFNNEKYSVGHPTLSTEGNILYFVSDMPGGYGGTDIYSCIIDEDGNYSTPVNLGYEVNTEGNEMFPFIHKSGVLFFASDGHVGLGGLDVFAKLKSGSIANLGAPINSPKDDFGLILDDKQEYGYFSSNRNETVGDDIYKFSMLSAFNVEHKLSGVITDLKDGYPVSDAIIILQDKEGNTLAEYKTDEDGSYSIPLEPGKEYKIITKLEDYLNIGHNFSTYDAKAVKQDLALERSIGFTLYGIVNDTESKEPLEGVKITLIDNKTGKQIFDGKTNKNGEFTKKLEDNHLNDDISVSVKMKREGFRSKTVDVNTNLSDYGNVVIHKIVDLSLPKIEVGTDIGKLAALNPIYFDYNKWHIRNDAKIELDKIVKIMNKNPGIIIELGSHTDSRGSDSFNLKLSDKRAKASAEYIIEQGIDKNRISGKGLGETKLINKCDNGVNCSDEEHALNRRTEFKIVKF